MSKIYDDAKTVTLKQIRALKVGDLIKAFYTDTEEPVLHLVTSQWGNSKTGVLRDIDTVPLSAFGHRSSDVRGCRSLNTDKWVRVAHGGDLVDMLTRHATQQDAPKAEVVTFAPGDEVRFHGEPGTEVITEACLKEWGAVEYDTTRGSWYTEKDFTLVKRATQETMERAKASIELDDDEEIDVDIKKASL